MKRLAAFASLALVSALPLAPSYAQRAKAGDELKIILGIAANELLSGASGVDVRQTGSNNSAGANQNGPGNAAAINQVGNGQSANVGQNGRVNRSDVSQYGFANTAAMNQTGNRNYACLIQVGVGLNGEVNQSGRRQAMGVLQTPGGARDIPPELCFIEKVGRKYVEQRRSR